MTTLPKLARHDWVAEQLDAKANASDMTTALAEKVSIPSGVATPGYVLAVKQEGGYEHIPAPSGGSGGSSVYSVAGRTGAVVLSSEDITDLDEAVLDVMAGASPCTDDFVVFNGGTPLHPDTPPTYSLSGSVFTVTRPGFANPSGAWDYNFASIPLGTVEELQGRRYFIRADDRDSEAKIDYAGSGFTASPTASRVQWPQIGSVIDATTGQWLVFDNLYELAVGMGYPPTDTFYLVAGQATLDVTTPAINWKLGAAYTTEDAGAGDNVIIADGLRGAGLSEFTTASEVEAMINGKAQYITCWGDSLTAIGGWTEILQTLSLTVYNAGTGGENAQAVMARQGGDVMMVNNITIPATTTPVLVNTRAGDGGILTAFGHRVMPLLQGGSEHVNPVRIGDIEGTLIWTGADYSDIAGTWTFTRSVAGSEVVIDRPTAMTTGYDRNRNDGIMIVFMGQNGGWADDDDLVNMHKLMRAHHRGEHMVVLGLSSGSSASRATYEAAMRKEFGRYFISLREYLSTYGLADAGFTPTGADTTAMAAGEVPPQLLADGVHYTSECKAVIGNMLYKKMRELGIIA